MLKTYVWLFFLFFNKYINFRGSFIIDDAGNFRQMTVNDLSVGRSVDEALRLVQTLKFVDKHGEGYNIDILVSS